MNSAKAHTRWMMAWATGVSLVWGHQAPAQEAAKKPEPPKAYLKGEWAKPDSFVPARDARAYIQKTLDNVRKEAAEAKKGPASR